MGGRRAWWGRALYMGGSRAAGRQQQPCSTARAGPAQAAPHLQSRCPGCRARRAAARRQGCPCLEAAAAAARHSAGPHSRPVRSAAAAGCAWAAAARPACCAGPLLCPAGCCQTAGCSQPAPAHCCRCWPPPAPSCSPPPLPRRRCWRPGSQRQPALAAAAAAAAGIAAGRAPAAAPAHPMPPACRCRRSCPARTCRSPPRPVRWR